MKYLKILLFTSAFFSLSCTDGTQTGMYISKLIIDHNIEIVSIHSLDPEGKILNKDYAIENVIIDNQFMEFDKTFINLCHIKSAKIKENTLEISL